MKEAIYDFRYLHERDIDIFLMYSFAVDDGFLELFINKLDYKIDKPLITGIEISRQDESGESDVTVCFVSGGKRYALLIEDKIDAPAQPDQCNRYYQRGEKDVSNGAYDAFAVFICAPQKYIESNTEASKYEYSVSFEEIEEYLSNKDDAFSKVRLSELEQLRSVSRKSSQSIPDEAATTFWFEYIDFVRTNYPDLDLCVTVNHKPKDGAWLEFRTPHKDRHMVRIEHKCNFGYMDLQFGKLGGKLGELAEVITDQIGDFEEQGFVIEQATESASLRRRDERPLDFNKPFSSQLDVAKEHLAWIYKLHLIAKDLDIERIKDLRSEVQES